MREKVSNQEESRGKASISVAFLLLKGKLVNVLLCSLSQAVLQQTKTTPLGKKSYSKKI